MKQNLTRAFGSVRAVQGFQSSKGRMRRLLHQDFCRRTFWLAAARR